MTNPADTAAPAWTLRLISELNAADSRAIAVANALTRGGRSSPSGRSDTQGCAVTGPPCFIHSMIVAHGLPANSGGVTPGVGNASTASTSLI